MMNFFVLKYLKKSFLFLVIFFLASACSYVKDKPPANNNVYKTDELKVCQIDVDKLAEIFKANQEAEIRCLMDNFLQYTRYFKTTNPDTVSENELGNFARKVFKGQTDQVVQGLSVIFQLNTLLLKDEAQKLSKGNITPLFELLVSANREAIIVTDVLKEMGKQDNDKNFFELREKFLSAVQRFSDSTIKIMRTKTGVSQSLKIKDFILDAASKLGRKEISLNMIDSLMSLKQIFVGGDREVITTSELEILLGKLPDLLTLSFDVYYSHHDQFKTESDEAHFYLLDLRKFASLLEYSNTNQKVVTVDQIIKFYQDNVQKDDLVNVGKFKPSILALKKRLIGGDENSFTLLDVKKILELSIDVNERIYFDYVTSALRKKEMESTKPLRYEDLTAIDSSNYPDLTYTRVDELTKNFNQILVEFKYYRESMNSIPYYGVEVHRSKYGLVEVSLLRWFSQKLHASYGKIRNGEAQVNLEEFQKFLLEMRPILEELKLWPSKFSSFARNTVLLADLFQSQSNGDGLVNEREATEFAQMILSATEITSRQTEEFKKVCDSGFSPYDPIFEVKCFNENLFDTFLSDNLYKKDFPFLNAYKTASTPENLVSYVEGLETFARDLNDPQLPMNKRDSILTLGAMINVETTFLRFDTNRDNILDINELKQAFLVYRQSIISLAKLSPNDYGYAESIFLYMVSKMKVPPSEGWLNNMKFVSWHYCVQSPACRNSLMDKIEAGRMNIGSLLAYIVNTADANARVVNIKK